MTTTTRFGLGLAATVLLSSLAIAEAAHTQVATGPTPHAIAQYGEPPAVPDGPLSSELQEAVQAAFVDSMVQSTWGPDQVLGLDRVTNSEDPRLVWLVADLMRFVSGGRLGAELTRTAAILLQIDPPAQNQWGVVTDHLIAWDIPAPPGYLPTKRAIFTSVVPEWEPLFADGDIDWRHVSWGGVPIDDRPFGRTDEPCDCIPAADDPEVETADEAAWLADDDIVFGIVVNGEARAYPRRIMEVREMVNDSLGGRDLGIPYCTLCGAAQAYFTDGLPDGIERPVLRTSGLLIRSNKMMFDLNTYSVLDTFLGKAVTGPLAEKGVTLEKVSVVTSDWGSWKAAHPDTTVLVEDLALGRDFDFRSGRDADGPIFPIGDVDPRLPVHEDVVGVVTASGTPIAFQRSQAVAALKRGETVDFEDARLEMDGGGIRAVGADGADLGSHEAFWFAWSQFHPDTVLWGG